MTEGIKMFIFSSTNIMSKMSSVERIYDYIECKDYEKDWERPKDLKLHSQWPEKGSIKVKKLNIRYREDLPLVLKNISFEVEGGQKVAVVGRTGSGKSSLLLALMRILENEKNEDERVMAESGIFIDKIDVGTIGLHKLRSKMAIIPQIPFLFQGTIRSNIDPYSNYDDETILNFLENLHFLRTLKKNQFEDFEGDESSILKMKVEKGGKNFSIGQRQLLTIVRSLIKGAKILLMDEATSSTDDKTDEIIQEVIKKMKDTTVLTVAHRLNTVMYYDKIFVFDNGVIVEEGNPKNLKMKEGGYFNRMIQDNAD